MNDVMNFLKSINKWDHVIIIFHNDGDGICAALLLKKFLEKKAGNVIDALISQPMPVNKTIVNRIKTFIPNKIILLDLAVDQQPEIIRELKKYSQILVIDHHKISDNLNGKKVIHYNPRFKNPDVFESCSYIVYKICSKLENMENYLWICAIGIISDYDTNDSKDILEKVREKYPDMLKSVDKDAALNSYFSKVSDLILAAKATKRATSEQILNILSSINSPEEITKSDKAAELVEAYKDVEQELENIKVRMQSECEKHGDLILYNLKSKYNISSPVASMLGEIYPDKLIVVWRVSNNKIKLNARNQQKNINAAKSLVEAVKGLNASAGGHDAAAGGTINKKDWLIFKKNLIKMIANASQK